MLRKASLEVSLNVNKELKCCLLLWFGLPDLVHPIQSGGTFSRSTGRGPGIVETNKALYPTFNTVIYFLLIQFSSIVDRRYGQLTVWSSGLQQEGLGFDSWPGHIKDCKMEPTAIGLVLSISNEGKTRQ